MPNFIKSASSPNDWINDQVAEICFSGRSNVGKSTLINALANQQIAKSSKTPGRTQLVNFYNFGSYRLVDLPGYGYMVGSHQLKQDVKTIIDTYLSSRTNLFAIFQICDANVITELDVAMSQYFQKRFKNHFIVLNKVDKGKLSMYQNKQKQIAKYLKVPEEKIIFISAKNKVNINKISHLINGITKNI